MAALAALVLLERLHEVRLMLAADLRNAVNLGKGGPPALDAVATLAHLGLFAALRGVAGGCALRHRQRGGEHRREGRAEKSRLVHGPIESLEGRDYGCKASDGPATRLPARKKSVILGGTPRSGQTRTRPAPGAYRSRYLRLVLDAFPLVRVGGSRLALDNGLPLLRELRVECDERLLVGRNVVFRVDRLDRALGHAERAVDAFVGVDHEEVRTLAKAIHGADVDAIGILAADAGLGDDVGHAGPSGAGKLDFSKSGPMIRRSRSRCRRMGACAHRYLRLP